MKQRNHETHEEHERISKRRTKDRKERLKSGIGSPSFEKMAITKTSDP